MRIKREAVYLGDNGRAACGEHLGYTAQTTGRDLSGQEILEVTPAVLGEADRMNLTVKCESCGREPSRLYI